jgi:hypothetical protein
MGQACGSGEVGFGICTRSREDKAGGAAGASVTKRFFYGYRFRGVTGNQIENTKNGESESPKNRHLRVRSRTAKKNAAIFTGFFLLLLSGRVVLATAAPDQINDWTSPASGRKQEGYAPLRIWLCKECRK